MVELATDYLESAMPPEEIARFEYHLALCEGCLFYVEQIRMTIEADRRGGCPPDARDGLVAAFRDFKRSL